jgi:hypothetical protein
VPWLHVDVAIMMMHVDDAIMMMHVDDAIMMMHVDDQLLCTRCCPAAVSNLTEHDILQSKKLKILI